MQGNDKSLPFFALTAKDKSSRLHCTLTLSFFLHRSEVPFQQPSVNKCPPQTGNLMLTPHLEESTCKCLSQMGSATRPHPSLTCTSLPPWTQGMPHAGQGPELWSPASFMSQMKAGSEEVSVLLKEQSVCVWAAVRPLIIAVFSVVLNCPTWILSCFSLVLAVIFKADQVNCLWMLKNCLPLVWSNPHVVLCFVPFSWSP